MNDPIFDLIKEARKQAQRGNFAQARHLYTTSVDQIRRQIKGVHIKQRTFWTVELWLALSELLSMRSDFPEKGESFEDCRKMRLDSLRFLYKAVASRSEYISEDHQQKLADLQEKTIYKFGCIVPETDTQIEISCPIYIRNSLPFPNTTSNAFAYEKNVCSICERDMLDESCTHIPGKQYGDKHCTIIPRNFTFLHTAIVSRPKDPRATIEGIIQPKDWSMNKLCEDEKARKIKENLPFICYFCRDRNIKASAEINIIKFFEMQKINIDLEDSNISAISPYLWNFLCKYTSSVYNLISKGRWAST